MFAPSGSICRTCTRSPSTMHCSMGTTQSAPAGIGAPVAIRTASPPPTVTSGVRPIGARPTTRSKTGSSETARAMSEARTANPSIAEEEKEGMSSSATTSEARTQPWASWRCSSIGVRGRMRSRIIARTSSTGRISEGSPWSWCPPPCCPVSTPPVPVLPASTGSPGPASPPGRSWRVRSPAPRGGSSNPYRPPCDASSSSGSRAVGDASRSSANGSLPKMGTARRASSAGPDRPGWSGTPGPGRLGRWRAPRWPGGSRASSRCRTGCPRTHRHRPSAAGRAG